MIARPRILSTRELGCRLRSGMAIAITTALQNAGDTVNLAALERRQNLLKWYRFLFGNPKSATHLSLSQVGAATTFCLLHRCNGSEHSISQGSIRADFSRNPRDVEISCALPRQFPRPARSSELRWVLPF